MCCRWSKGSDGSKPTRQVFNDLWVLDCHTWTWEELSAPRTGANAPVPRSACSMAIMQHHLLVFGGKTGGQDAVTFFADLWSFDLETGRWCAAARVIASTACRIIQSALTRACVGIPQHQALFCTRLRVPYVWVLPARHAAGLACGLAHRSCRVSYMIRPSLHLPAQVHSADPGQATSRARSAFFRHHTVGLLPVWWRQCDARPVL